jgi:hypothetical protein
MEIRLVLAKVLDFQEVLTQAILPQRLLNKSLTVILYSHLLNLPKILVDTLLEESLNQMSEQQVEPT